MILYQYPNCSTCKKALKELETLGVSVETIDIKKNPPTAEVIELWMKESSYTVKQFFNTSGQSYRALGLKDRIDNLSPAEAAQLLASDGMLIKRPILVKDGQVVQIGYRTPYASSGVGQT